MPDVGGDGHRSRVVKAEELGVDENLADADVLEEAIVPVAVGDVPDVAHPLGAHELAVRHR